MRWRFLIPFLVLGGLAVLPVAAANVSNTTTTWCIVSPDCFQLQVATGSAINITRESALLRGNLVSLDDSSTWNVSFEWGVSPTLGFETPDQERNTTGQFEAPLVGLEPGQVYYVRARATGNGTVNGAIVTFTMGEIALTPEDITLIFVIILVVMAIFLILLGVWVDMPVLWMIAGLFFSAVAFWAFANLTGNLQSIGTVSFMGLGMIFIGIGALLQLGEG